MNTSMLKAFREEVLEIEKTAGFMRDVGSNVGNTLKAFTTPVQSIKRGWTDGGGWTAQGDAQAAVRRGQAGPTMRMWARGKGAGRFMPGGKSLTVAFGAVEAPGLFKKEDPRGEGRSKLHRTAQFVGGQAGGLIGAPFGISGAMAGAALGDYVGGKVGKGVDRLRGKKQGPVNAETQREARVERTADHSPQMGP